MAIKPSLLGASSCPSSFNILISKPGTALLDEPGFIAAGSTPIRFAIIGQPDSVCHQWSIIGNWVCSCNQWYVAGSHLSPATKIDFKLFIEYFFNPFASGSSFFIALNAVGAANNKFTLYSSTPLQKEA